MPTAYIYILHFDVPLSHAEHYSGTTENLKGRLQAHATGAGSNLCRVLKERGISWRLGGLYTTTHVGARRIERQLKNQHNGPRFCTLCTAIPSHVPGCRSYPIDYIPFPTDSHTICVPPTPITDCRLTGPHETPHTIKFIMNLMSRDKDALGFIPAGGAEGLQITHDRGLIAIVSNNDEDVGYAALTMPQNLRCVNIQQCCIRDDARLMGNGARLIEFVAQTFPRQPLIAKVRTDLAANEFWTSIGFEQIREAEHKTSGNRLITYVRKALFV